jgi:1-phosphofructokinase family hexose kinase
LAAATKQPVVVALNPSIDAEWRVDRVLWEEKNNILAERRWAGGKGVNVARWLKHLGAKPRLILPLGGASGSELAAQLKRERLSARIIPLREATRVNVIVTTRTQGQLRFNPAGPTLSRREWQTTLDGVRRALRQAGCLVLSGSLPRGVPVDAYAQLIRLAQAGNVPAFLDCDGRALAAAVRARPFLVKPNEHELLEWFRSAGRRPGPVGQASRLSSETQKIHTAALALSRQTCGWVFVSRGAKPALLVNACAQQCLTARPPAVKPRHTIGAGDSLLAAVVLQVLRGASPEQWLQAGLATGSAATQVEAGCLPRRHS